MNPNTEEQSQSPINDATIEALSKREEEASKEEASGGGMSLLMKAVGESEQRARDQIILTSEMFKHKQRLAGLFALSGCFSDIKGKTQQQALAQAFVKMELGASMGFTDAESMQGINLIQGTPSISAQLRAARMQRAGYSWEIDWFEDAQGNCTGCRLWLSHNGHPVLKPKRDEDGNVILNDDQQPIHEQVNVGFLKKDAEKLMTKIWDVPQPGTRDKTFRVASVLEKDNWKNTPMNMYFSRAVTNLQRWYAPGVLSANLPTTDEVLDGSENWGGGQTIEMTGQTAEDIAAARLAAAAKWHAEQGRKMPGMAPKTEPAEIKPLPSTPAETGEKEPATKEPPKTEKMNFGTPRGGDKK